MKKIVATAITALSLLYGFELKSNKMDVGIRVGNLNQNHVNYLYGSLKLGYYFLLFPNRYRISNEVFIDGVQTVGAKYFNMVDIGLNWVTNLAYPFDFFAGVRGGWIRRDGKDGHTWGFQGGLLYKINRQQILEAGVSWDNIFDNPDPDKWGHTIVRGWVGLDFYGF
jgi:hypothetical protein